MIKAVKLEEGSTLPEALEQRILSEGLKGGLIAGVGGFRRAEIGYYNPLTSEFTREVMEAPENEILEVLSLLGNYMVRSDGSLSMHIHVTLGIKDAGAKGGHLIKAAVRPYLELFLIEAGDLRQVLRHRDRT
ncbi:MAG: DUF296 domain-containing protein [Zestosphaera sp.]